MTTATAETLKCTTCGKLIEYDESAPGQGFKCPKLPGKHSVPERTYYHLGGGHIQNHKERRMFQVQMCLRGEIEQRDENGRVTRMLPALIVQTEPSGILRTADPEVQYYMDAAGFAHGEVGLRAWQKLYYTPDQQLALAKDELAETERKIKEQNALLESVKSRSGKGAGN